jgi:superfamily II DNA/RNA helicase
VVVTRTKHGAKALARQLNRSGVPAVELHGNLGQNARTRNLEAFHAGRASTLVATDIAARGIHVDDVALVVHADPPSEHKAYLHRSGRTARAGNSGTVITLATGEQIRDVRGLTRAAGIAPTTTRVHGDSHPLLVQLAPGERALTEPLPTDSAPAASAPRPAKAGSGRRSRPRRQKPRANDSRPDASTTQRRDPSARPAGKSRSRRRRGGGKQGGSTGGGHSAAAFSAGRR